MRGVELIGVGLNNRGAELMLRSVGERVHAEGLSLVVGQSVVPGSHLESVGGARMARLDPHRHRFLWRTSAALGELVPSGIWASAGILPTGNRVGLLDSSGFGYGDAWGSARNRRREKLFSWYRDSHLPVILLPQAFGPFGDPEVRRSMQRLMKHVTLVFARDKVSHGHLVDLLGEDSRIRLAPDFTCEVKGVAPSSLGGVIQNRACIIPNGKMLTHTPPEVAEAYVPYMASALEVLHAAGFDPFLLLHESEEDGPLCRRILECSEVVAPVYSDLDAVASKGVIGRASIVVGSRYHGLVSSLAQGVPAMGTTWSHKYQELFDFFGVGDLIVRELDPSAVGSDLAPLLDPARREALVSTIRDGVTAMESEVRAMWSEVMGLLLNS
jgi:hypothetical protein